MFEIAWSELLIVLIVAIVVVGPKELPGLLRTIGRVLGKVRRSADEFRRQFDETMRDTGAEDIQREINQLRYHNPLNEIRNTIEEAARDVNQAAQLPSLDAPATETPPAARAAADPAAPAAAENGAAPDGTQPAPATGTGTTGNASGPEPRLNGENRPVN